MSQVREKKYLRKAKDRKVMSQKFITSHEAKYDDIKNRMVFLLSLFHGIIKVVEKLFFTFLKRDQLLMPQRSGEVKENKNSFRLFFSSTIRIFCTEHREPGGFSSFQKILEKYITKEMPGKVKLTTGGMRYTKCTTPSNFRNQNPQGFTEYFEDADPHKFFCHPYRLSLRSAGYSCSNLSLYQKPEHTTNRCTRTKGLKCKIIDAFKTIAVFYGTFVHFTSACYY